MRDKVVFGLLSFALLFANYSAALAADQFAFRCNFPGDGKTPAIRLGVASTKDPVLKDGRWNVNAALTLGQTMNSKDLSIELKSFHVEPTMMFLGLDALPGTLKRAYLAFWLPGSIDSMNDGEFTSGPTTDLTLYKEDGETKDQVYSGIPMSCHWVNNGAPKIFAPLGAGFMGFVNTLMWNPQ